MGHRKIINRMVKSQRKSSDMQSAIFNSMNSICAQEDPELYNIHVEAYSVHVKIWNQLQRYIKSLKVKSVKRSDREKC